MARLGYDYTKDVTSPTRVAPQPQFISRNYTNPYVTPTGTGLPSSAVDAYHEGTAAELAGVRAAYEASIRAAGGGSGYSGAADRQAANDRLKYGLAGLDLQREGVGLDRDALGLSRIGAGLDRRDALERAVNNALQRGIYRSGIRIRNEQRVNERADLVEQGLDIDEDRLDLRDKTINLSEDELRASVKNALAAINEQVAASRRAASQARAAQIAQRDMALYQVEMQRRQALDSAIMDYGGVFDDTPILPNPVTTYSGPR